MMLSAAERIVLRIPIAERFVSEKELSGGQMRLAKAMAARGLLARAGSEPDGSAVYQATDEGRRAFEEWGR